MNVVAWFHKCPECFSRKIQRDRIEVEGNETSPYDFFRYQCLECGAEFDEHTHLPDETTPNYYVFVYDSNESHCHPYAVTLNGASIQVAMDYGIKLLESYPHSVVMLVWAESGANPGAAVGTRGG